MRSPAVRRQLGIALLLVLWAFMVLGVLAFDFGRTIRDDAMAAVNYAEETQSYYMALAAMNRAIYADQLERDNRKPDDDPEQSGRAGPGLSVADGQWHDEEVAGGKAEVRVTDECARIPLNYAAAPLLHRVITNLVRGTNATEGTDRRETAEIDGVVGAIMDWRDSDSFTSPNGAENEFYRSRGYRAKNALFDSPQELLLVKGVTADLFYGGEGQPGLRDIVSVFCRTATLNASTITAPVLVALGVDAAEADELVARRAEDELAFQTLLEARLNAIDPTLAELVQPEEPQMVLVEARADLSRERNRSSIAAVMNLEESGLGEQPVARLWMDRAPWQGDLPRGTAGGRVPESAP